MYIEIGADRVCVNLSQLVWLNCLDLPAGAKFNNEILAQDVHAINFTGQNNQMTLRFPNKEGRDAVYAQCQELAKAWREGVLRGGSGGLTKPVLVPNFSGK